MYMAGPLNSVALRAVKMWTDKQVADAGFTHCGAIHIVPDLHVQTTSSEKFLELRDYS